MAKRTTTTVEYASFSGVDPDLVAGCQTFRECPREAAWAFVYPGIRSNTICDHHLTPFMELMRDIAKLDISLLRFVRI